MLLGLRNELRLAVSSPSARSKDDLPDSGIDRAREEYSATLTPREVGTILSVSTGVAMVSGLPTVGFAELVMFPGRVLGIDFNVDHAEIGSVPFGPYWNLPAGDEG